MAVILFRPVAVMFFTASQIRLFLIVAICWDEYVIDFGIANVTKILHETQEQHKISYIPYVWLYYCFSLWTE